METHLRLILFIVGSIILALVVWDIIKQRNSHKLFGSFERQVPLEPELEYANRQQSLFSKIEIINPCHNNDSTEINDKCSLHSLDDMFALFVIAKDPKGFAGSKLKQLLESANLQYGKMKIFHKYDEEENQVMFSVASAVEPGIFDLKELSMQFVPGITMFTVFSNVTDPRKAFDVLVRTAKQLAFGLNGELRDQYHNPLTLQIIEGYKSNLEAYS